jgi:hypothetical protein
MINTKNNVQKYLNQIQAELHPNEYKYFLEQLENIENKLVLDKSIRPLKKLIVDIIRTFMITNKRIQVGNKFNEELISIREDKDMAINALKGAVQNLSDIICKDSNIPIPEHVSGLLLQSSVKTEDSLRKIFNAITNNSSKEVQKYLESLPINKLVPLDNSILKTAAKKSSEKIRISKNEKNTI